MILGEQALSAANAQISGCKEPVTTEPVNMPWFLLTIWQRLRTQANYRSAAIKITWKLVTDCNDKDKYAIIIASSKVEEQFNLVKEFANRFPKTISSKLLPLRNINYHINPNPGTEWLPTWRTSSHHLGNKLMTNLTSKQNQNTYAMLLITKIQSLCSVQQNKIKQINLHL